MKTLFYFVASLTLLACSSKADSQTQKENTQKYPANLEADSFPDGEPVHESGVLLDYEDAGYPFFVLKIKINGTSQAEEFNVNLEELNGFNLEKLSRSKNRKVDVTFIHQISNDLLDMRKFNKSIFNDNEPVSLNGNKTVKGFLAGAENITDGDLPGKIKIVTTKAKVYEFEYFISPEMVAHNGQLLTAVYRENNRMVIRDLVVR